MIFKTLNNGLTRIGQTADRTLTIVEVNLNHSLEESIDEAISDLKKMESTKEERRKYIEEMRSEKSLRSNK